MQNTEEALVIILTHEALHAKHMAVYYDAYREGGKSTSGIVQYLTDRNYDREFIEIFCVQQSDGEWDHNSWEVIERKLHEYMGKHDCGVIDAALQEYREDHNDK